MLKTSAYQIADSINIKEFKKNYVGNLRYFDSDELFYENVSNKFIYIFDYGVVCFLGLEESEISSFLSVLSDYTENPLTEKICEDFIIEINETKQVTLYNKILIKEFDSEIVRLIMLNVSQSVALDYFSKHADNLLKQTKVYTVQLEEHGKLYMQGKKLKKFIGRSLNLKNKISQHLYIFDSHPGTWENEELNKIDISMKKAFDLYNRSRNLQEVIEIIKDNLELFIDIMHHKKSSFLEWIIIILILVEVVNMFIEKLL